MSDMAASVGLPPDVGDDELYAAREERALEAVRIRRGLPEGTSREASTPLERPPQGFETASRPLTP